MWWYSLQAYFLHAWKQMYWLAIMACLINVYCFSNNVRALQRTVLRTVLIALWRALLRAVKDHTENMWERIHANLFCISVDKVVCWVERVDIDYFLYRRLPKLKAPSMFSSRHFSKLKFILQHVACSWSLYCSIGSKEVTMQQFSTKDVSDGARRYLILFKLGRLQKCLAACC